MTGEERSRVDLSKDRENQRDVGDDWFGELMSPTPVRTPARDSWVLDFSFATNPISPNGSRENPFAHSKKVRMVRRFAKLEAERAKIPHLGRARVQLTWYVVTRGRRDAVNLALTLKALVDGLVDAGVTPDDTPNYVDTPMPEIILVDHARHQFAWMELLITRWDGLE